MLCPSFVPPYVSRVALEEVNVCLCQHRWPPLFLPSSLFHKEPGESRFVSAKQARNLAGGLTIGAIPLCCQALLLGRQLLPSCTRHAARLVLGTVCGCCVEPRTAVSLQTTLKVDAKHKSMELDWIAWFSQCDHFWAEWCSTWIY